MEDLAVKQGVSGKGEIYMYRAPSLYVTWLNLRPADPSSVWMVPVVKTRMPPLMEGWKSWVARLILQGPKASVVSFCTMA